MMGGQTVGSLEVGKEFSIFCFGTPASSCSVVVVVVVVSAYYCSLLQPATVNSTFIVQEHGSRYTSFSGLYSLAVALQPLQCGTAQQNSRVAICISVSSALGKLWSPQPQGRGGGGCCLPALRTAGLDWPQPLSDAMLAQCGLHTCLLCKQVYMSEAAWQESRSPLCSESI